MNALFNMREVLRRLSCFYLGLKDVVPADVGTAELGRVASEEMRHVAALTGELKKAKAA